MSDTPETDGEVNQLKSATTCNMVYVEFARKMERERDEARLDLAFRRNLYALQQKQLDKARELAANLEVSLTAAIRSANVRQDETEHAMHECSELRILVDGLSEMTHELSEERNRYYNELLTKRGLCKVQEQVIDDWKAEAEKWRAIADDHRN